MTVNGLSELDKKCNKDRLGFTECIKTGLSTLGLASLGTLALVSAHHLGRKQYDKNVRWSDYSEGVLAAWRKRMTMRSQAQYSKSHSQTPLKPKTAKNTNDTVGSISIIQPRWISGVANLKTNDFGVVAIDLQRHIVWHTWMPERLHDILIQPSKPIPHVAVMGRRPSEFFWILDSQTGDVLHRIHSDSNRHYYGHGCYSLEGTILYVTENDTANFAGKLGCYDVANGYQKMAEFATHGIGPHELLMHTDGDTIVIANGGIKTESASREELNIDSMQPSLVYINRHDGRLLEQVFPQHNQMSVRHLSLHADGRVVIGIQFQGERHLKLPLLLTHQRGESSFTPLQMPKDDSKGWHRFHHYIASVAVDSGSHLLCATSPIGGCAAIFDLTTGLMLAASAVQDCAGVTLWKGDHYAQDTPSFLVSDGQGYLSKLSLTSVSGQHKITTNKTLKTYAFDNHLKYFAQKDLA